ncbi:MAG: DUF3857 domain-containing protein [Candidatus Krumholzibacteriota bacterium]
MKMMILFPALVLLASTPAAATIDYSATAVWGAATEADTLAMHLTEARWFEDAVEFEAVKSDFWERYPHEDRILAAVVRWHRDRTTLTGLLDALAAGSAEEFTGLDGLRPEDEILLEGFGLVCAGYLASARALLEPFLVEHPHSPLGLAAYFLAVYGTEQEDDVVRSALADSRSAHYILTYLITENFRSKYHFQRDEILATLESRPARPQLAAMAAGQEMIQAARRPGLTGETFAQLLDGFHADNPAVCIGFLESLFRSALAMVSSSDLQEILAQRSYWIPSEKYRLCLATLQQVENLDLQAYRTLSPVERGFAGVPWFFLIGQADWNPDADQVERWARLLPRGDLSRTWQAAAEIFRDRNLSAAADSLRQVVALENPLAHQHSRLRTLLWEDPASGTALLDSLVACLGEGSFLWEQLYAAESRGDREFLSAVQASMGISPALENFGGAIMGAMNRIDLDRMEELAAFVRKHAPGNTVLLHFIAQVMLAGEHTDPADAVLQDLAEFDPPPPTAAGLRIRSALMTGDQDKARSMMRDLLDAPDTPPEVLVKTAPLVERAGMPDLANQALERIEAEAPAGCRKAGLVRAEVLGLRGELDESRSVLAGLQAVWPGSEAVDRLLIEAGGLVETYKDPRPDTGTTSLAGLEFDYTATDWIEDRRAGPDEFPGQEMLVLRNRESNYLPSATQLVTRTRFTVQILSDFAALQLETVRVPFFNDGDVPRVLCARIIAPGGEVREIPLDQAMVTAHAGEEANVSDRRDLVIPFPGLKTGMVVDCCYQVSTPPFLNLGHAWTYTYGNIHPQREEIVELVVADGVEHYLFTDHQAVETEREDLSGTTLYRWRMVDRPAVLWEEAAPLEAVLPHWIGCTTYDSWDQVASFYGDRFDDKTKLTDAIGDLAAQLTSGFDNDADRAQALFAYVQDEIDNIGIEVGPGRLVPMPSEEVIARGYGDCKDKVAVLASLAAGVGLECLPVLVGTRPSPAVEKGFPNASAFDHLIAYFPGLDRGTFADPTLGTGCLADLPENVAGQRGLLIRSDGSGKLVRIPEIMADPPRLDIEIDLHPEADGKLRAEVSATVRSLEKEVLETMLDAPDTLTADAIVQAVLGNQVSESLVLLSCSKHEIDCGTLGVEAVFRDTLWASPSNHDAFLVWVASTDTDVMFPEEEERKLPFEIESAKVLKVTLRAHEEMGWRLSARHSPIKVSAPGFEGKVEVLERDQDGRRWLEIRREVRFDRRVYSPEEFLEVRDQYYSYALASCQPIRHHRLSDDSRIEDLRAYCRENPDDLAFSFQAAQQVLGGDMGGDGEAGVERRAVARELLAPALAHPDVGGIPYLLAANIAITDNEYAVADSLLTIGLERSPRDPYLLGYAVFVDQQLGHRERVIENLLRVQSLTGDESFSFPLITQYLALGEDEKAAHEEKRLHLISTSVDSVQLVMAKIQGYKESNRMGKARDLMDVAADLMDPITYQIVVSDLAIRERRWEDAIEALTPVHSEYPLLPDVNNNMAWVLACGGRDLGRAEYLVRMSISLSGGSAFEDNTLAVVLMRQGKTDEAMEIFTRMIRDDRPEQRVVNGYFIGLCQWIEGDRDRAVESWRLMEDVSYGGEFNRLVRESLAAVNEGRDPTWIYLSPVIDVD